MILLFESIMRSGSENLENFKNIDLFLVWITSFFSLRIFVTENTSGLKLKKKKKILSDCLDWLFNKSLKFLKSIKNLISKKL